MSMDHSDYNTQVLENAILQCKQAFEDILCVQTTALLKKSTFEKILIVLQDIMCKINTSVPANEVIHYDNTITEIVCEEVYFSRKKTNHKAFDSFKALCNEKKPSSIHKQSVYECADCKYQTPRKADLKKHLKRHMGVRNYCCNYCSRTFFDKYNLERHINANHTKKQQYCCKTCSYMTYFYDSLKRHEKVKHCDDTAPKFVCSVCCHMSSTKHDLTIHSYVHNKVKPFMCEECGSMFSLKSRLTTHKNTVHNQRMHTCQVCDKSFQTSSLLKRHSLIHSRFKPYSCPYCNHSSNSQSNLTKHVRNIHSQTDFTYHKFISGKL